MNNLNVPRNFFKSLVAVIILSLLEINIVFTLYYTTNNSSDIFTVFKEKYNKKYENTTEEENHFKTFVNNLNIIDKINENSTDGDTFFILNQYADLNPEEIADKYAISIKPCKQISIY